VPRPEQKIITFTVDGREVQAPEGMMVVDAAKLGDVEIPYFCYEPKLGAPVGACRMCLVEIEGIPKLQTACSTPVKDGMVVNTQSKEVKEAQEAVVEFLLVNHPLDCPVCDKGGECPLQDISYGWGSGISRFVEPKRHFEKPLELSPLVAIDRERCILCYRCVRFSQEVSEDDQLVLQERGADSYVATFDGHPYVSPFSGNIIELCPVGALTSIPYRFRARPWDIEQSGSVCTLCPAQCNVSLTVRDDKVQRVLARDNVEVDDGWLCDKGRFGYQAFSSDQRVTEPLVRDGGKLRPATWERALAVAADSLSKAGKHSAALIGGGATNEEGYLLQKIFRTALGSSHIDSRSGAKLPARALQALGSPDTAAKISDIDYAHTVLLIDCDLREQAPILDLRVRKALRRNGAKLALASSRPTKLDSKATSLLRFNPGGVEVLLAALDGELGGEKVSDQLLTSAGIDSQQLTELTSLLKSNGQDVVVIYAEQLFEQGSAENTAAALLNIATRLELETGECSGLLEIPEASNGRGLREVGCVPQLEPGATPTTSSGLSAKEIAEAAVSGEVESLLLFEIDPTESTLYPGLWRRALDCANTVVAHTTVLTEGLKESATVVFPAEFYAEKEGTVTHLDGRLQRVRPAVGRPQGLQASWRVLAELGSLAGLKSAEFTSTSQLTHEVIGAVDFYSNVTLEQIGGQGVRWQDLAEAARYPDRSKELAVLNQPKALDELDGKLLLSSQRSLFKASEVSISPALNFLATDAELELSVHDAQQLKINHGESVTVTAGSRQLTAFAVVKQAVPVGSVFLVESSVRSSDSPILEIVKSGTPVEVGR